MLFKKKRDIGRLMEELKVGEKVEITRKIEDKDILLYLGLSNDANPIFIQHDYASRTPFKKPIVPHVMIDGFVNATISTYLPGPGSVIKKQSLSYPHPLYHYGSLQLQIEITHINELENIVTMKTVGKDELDQIVLEGEVEVIPPYPWKPVTHDAVTFDNF